MPISSANNIYLEPIPQTMPDPLHISIDYDNTQFTPGETISGTVSWTAPQGTRRIVLRLFWFTSGRGTQNIVTLDELEWPVTAQHQSTGQEPFAFVLPREPYSFSGTLVSLTWALEAVALPGELSLRKEFTLTPNGREIVLNSIDDPVTGSKQAKWLRKKFKK